MIKDKPFTGIGAGAFRFYSTEYNPELPKPHLAHNTYVNIAAELGVPAAGIFLAMLFFAWRRGRQLAAYCSARKLLIGEQLGRSIEIGVVAYGVTALFLSADFIKHIWLLLYMGLALNQWLLQNPASAVPAVPAVPARQPLQKRLHWARRLPSHSATSPR
jgi:hypothetical protein